MASCTSLVGRVVAIVIAALVARDAAEDNDTYKCAGQADVLLVIDSSGSIIPPDYDLMRESVAALTTEFTIGPNATQFSALIFSSTVVSAFGFTTYKTNAEVKEAILNMPHLRGFTYTGTALRMARDYSFTAANGARPNVTRIVLCITDGISTNAQDTAAEAYLLKSSGVIVIAVGVGDSIVYDELTTIASSESLVFRVTDYSLLDAVRSQISTAICEAPVCNKCLFEGGYSFDLDPKYCDTFYQCFQGSAFIKRSCADGTFWDGVQCNHIAKVSCPTAVCNSRTSGNTYPSGKCCNKYYLCADNGELVATACPSGQTYDENIRACRPGANLTVTCAETGKLLCDVDLNGPIGPAACAGYAPDLFGNPCRFQFYQRVFNTAPGTYWNQASCSLVQAEDKNTCLGDNITDRDFTGPGGPAAVCNAVFLATYNGGSNAVYSERLNRQLNVYSFLQEAILINNGVAFTSQMRDPMLYYYFFNNRELASNIAFRIRFRLDLGFGNAQQNTEYDILSNSYCAQCRETVSFTVVATSSTRHVVTATFLTSFGNTVSTSAIIETNNPNDWLELRVIFGDSSVSGKLFAVSDFSSAASQSSDFNIVPKTPGSTIETNRCGFQLGRGSHSHFIGVVDEFAFYEYCQNITSVLQ